MQQFIEFGHFFDRQTRQYLVDYLVQKTNPTHTLSQMPFSFQKRLMHLLEALDKIFEEKNVKEITQNNPQLAQEIIEDTLKWLRKTYEKTDQENPHAEERKELDRWQHKPNFAWAESWDILVNFLKNIYQIDEIDTRFYEQKFNDLTKELTQKIDFKHLKESPLENIKPYVHLFEPLDMLIEDLLGIWENLLTAKSLAYELAKIDKSREEFCALLYAKVDEFVKLLSIITPFQSEVGRFWDMSRGLWQAKSFDILEKYAQLLQKKDEIQRLADMLGQMRKAEIETKEEIFENIISHKRWVTEPYPPAEMSGVQHSDRLADILPIEIALLNNEITESVFLKKYAEKQLQTWDYQNKILINDKKTEYFTQQRQKRKEKGAFILCVDTSGSMEGLPEEVAKVLAFAIIKMASQDNRKCFLISFSIGIHTINLLDLAHSLEEVVKFLLMSFHGGTDLMPAMIASINMLHTNDYKDADVLVVSDFVMFELREEIQKKMRQEQRKGTMFHSLTISTQANPSILQAFDYQWYYNPHDQNLIQTLAKDLREIF